MSEKQSTVSVLCNRRGSVSAGPLTLKPGVNDGVSEADFLEFRKTKLGNALVKQGIVQYAPKPVEDLYEPPKSDDNKSEASDEDKSEASDNEGGDPAPTLRMSAKDAIKYVDALDDIEELEACYTQEERKTVKAACIARAEALQEADEGDGSEASGDDKSEAPDNGGDEGEGSDGE